MLTRLQNFSVLSAVLIGALINPLAAQDPGAANQPTRNESPGETKPPIVVAADTVVTRDVPYTDQAADKLRTLDLYVPKGVQGAPVFVFIHGGGWNKRDKDEVGSQPKLFNSAGTIVVSLNYRLAPAIHHPENVKDVAAAIAWLHQNIARYGGDPNKIVLMGHSAGSHLAALVATDGRYLAAHGLRRNQLAGVVSLDGSAFDIPDRIKNGVPKIAENCRLAFGEREEVQADGSPINHIEGQVPLPPFLLVYLTEGSLNHAQSKQFAERVERSAGKARLVQISDGKSHQALCDDLGTDTDHAGSILIEFLKDVTR
jgi:acetyl esterase/lipase